MTEEDKPIYIIKASGEKEPFENEKLRNSLRKAGASSQVIEEIVGVIRKKLIDGMTTTEIYKEALKLLREIEEEIVPIKYSVRRAVMQLGPDGFSFEDFIGAMFRAVGYKVQLRQTIRGLCVAHEIDLIAQNDEEILIGEIKFHNKQGMKSDIKIVLYVKERFDDLMKGEFWKNIKKDLRKELLLITNTKFTSKAIQYAECYPGLQLMSWNYPEGGSLHKFIEEAKLYPLTCLESLSSYEKKLFLKNKIVLCRELKQGGERLFNLVGISPEKRVVVLREVEHLLTKK